MKPALEFYDVKAKSKFTSSEYRIEVKPRKKGGKTYFAVTTSPLSGVESWRIVSKEFAIANSASS